MDYPKLIYGSRILAGKLEERSNVRNALYHQALQCTDNGQLPEALKIYQELLSQDARNAVWWHGLGMLEFRRHEFNAAITAILRALDIDITIAKYHFDFGTVVKHLDQPQTALQQYSELTFNAANPGSLESLGEKLQFTAEASNQPDAYRNLGHYMTAQHRITEAVNAYETAYALDPDNLETSNSLATALQLNGNTGRASILFAHVRYREANYAAAIEAFEQGIAEGAGDLESYTELARALFKESRYSRVIEVCELAVKNYPGAKPFYQLWAWALSSTGQTDAAISLATTAADALGDPWFLIHERYLTLPLVYRSEDELSRCRSRFAAGLQHLAKIIPEHNPAALDRFRNNLSTIFELSYQGCSDLPLQRQFGEMLHRIMRARYPAWAKPRSMPTLAPNERIRVGYISSSLWLHSVSKLLLGWLVERDVSQFQIYSYHIGDRVDLMTGQFDRFSDHFRHPGRRLESACQQVLDDKLHILIHLDIGMDPIGSQIAALRLAPLQCAAWGHAVTTGLPTIDYFLSSDLMEPKNAQEHYSETLIRLPGVGACVPPPCLPPIKSRTDFGLPEDAVLYFSSQSVFKYLPQFDHVFAAIATQIPQARFIFPKRSSPELTQIFHNRLWTAFASQGLNADHFVQFVPELPYNDYLSRNRLADVFLDTIDSWSGGITTLDAVACGLPIVTLPGQFMRSRQSYGMLTQLGVEETIATTVDEYISIAVRLGREPDWRQEISSRLIRNQHRLFNDRTSVIALEQFYRHIVLQSQIR